MEAFFWDCVSQNIEALSHGKDPRMSGDHPSKAWRDYQEIDCPYLIYGISVSDVDLRWPLAVREEVTLISSCSTIPQ